MSAQLVIKHVANKTEFPLSIDKTATVAELKEQVANKAGIPKENIRLVCAGRIWQDSSSVGSYEPSDGAIVHCLNNVPKSAAASGIAPAQTLQPANPMMQMMGGMPPPTAAASSGDPMQQMMAQSQAMLAQNPEMMQQIMGSPMVQQMMSDPETMRSMMRMNPQMNQLMETRPEIARMLEDPEVLRQSMQMMSNPSLMREMTRNQDRALGNLDAMPGGHQALLQAHQDVVDPLFEALHGSGAETTQQNLQEYASQTEGAPNTQALANPWGAPAAVPTMPPQQAPAAGMPGANPMAAMMQPGMAGGNPMAAMMQPGMAGGNPMAAMMQQMMNPQGSASPTGAPPTESNPMNSMMQQMMQNPAMMQQSMQMAQQMFGGGAMGGTAPAIATAGQPNLATPEAGENIFGDPMAMQMAQQMLSNPSMTQHNMQMAQHMFPGGVFPGAGMNGLNATGGTNPALPSATTPANSASDGASIQAANPMANPLMPNPGMFGANPQAANPMAAMMQQMMANPAMLQQQQAMAQQLMGGYPGFGTPAMAPAAQVPMAGAPVDAEASEEANRTRFAGQLAQLTTMGFTNEALCLQMLARTNGRIDPAIDLLLSQGESS